MKIGSLIACSAVERSIGGLTSVMAWLHFGFLWPVSLLHKLHCLVDVVLGHVNLCSTGNFAKKSSQKGEEGCHLQIKIFKIFLFFF